MYSNQELANMAMYSNTNLTQQGPRPIDIVFNNISYTIKVKDPKAKCCNRLPAIRKEILKGVTGLIEHAKVTAIMGASGAGKTSLLNILACRIGKKRNIKLSGDLLVNMRPYSFGTFGKFANYVMQNDILMQTLTVRETLDFVAQLTLPYPRARRDAIVMDTVHNLKLEKCLDVLVGGPELKGISGGEKKRTSIAFELISDPQVVFLDEPTSGMDSMTAYVIVWYMKKLAASGNKTIAMTIHQPSSEIFELFDNLIFMVAGRLVYQGPAAQSVEYFKQLGFSCPQYSNPPDYFMSIMHHQSAVNVNNYPRYFQSYDAYLAPRVVQAIQASERGPWQPRHLNTSFCVSLGALMKRDFINTRRNPMLLLSKIGQAIILGLITGAIFWRLGQDYSSTGLSKSFNSKNGALFFLSISFFMSGMSPVILTFPLERAVFLKQQSNKMYSVFAYFMSRNLIQLPVLIITPLIMTLIIYWMIGLNSTAGHFFLFYLVAFLCTTAGSSYGLLVGSFFSDAKVASGLLPLIILPLMLFSGFYKNRADLAGWIGWIEYISPIKYAFVGFARNQYRDTAAPIGNLNFDVSFIVALIILVALIVASRFLAFLVLVFSRSRIQ